MSFLYLNDISPSSFRFENNDVFCRREQRLSIVWKSNRFRVKECDQIAARRDAPMGILFFRANSNGAAFNQIFECSKRRNFIDAIFSFSLSLSFYFLHLPFIPLLVSRWVSKVRNVNDSLR